VQIFDLITRLKSDGTLTQLVHAGIIAPKVVTYASIYERVEQQQRRRKRSSRKFIIIMVADEYKVHPTTVYRAINLMREPVAVCLNRTTGS
jgi:hypothetical protein